jgi:hypothetical protein
MPVNFSDLLDAYEFVSVTVTGEHQAYLCKQSGRIVLWSEGLDEEDELPDLDDNEKYLLVPDKRELDLGTRLVMDFARNFLPDDFYEVRRIFSKRGAYRQFRMLLERRRAIDQWYDFQAKATERALRDWCQANSIELAD